MSDGGVTIIMSIEYAGDVPGSTLTFDSVLTYETLTPRALAQVEEAAHALMVTLERVYWQRVST